MNNEDHFLLYIFIRSSKCVVSYIYIHVISPIGHITTYNGLLSSWLN